MPIKEKAVVAVRLFEETAEQRGIFLKKRKYEVSCKMPDAKSHKNQDSAYKLVVGS